jgi:hypothetical protein
MLIEIAPFTCFIAVSLKNKIKHNDLVIGLKEGNAK